MKLRVHPEERYQRSKEAGISMNQVGIWSIESGYDGQGCNNGECVPECRYYPQFGRIEDEEVIQRHNEYVERFRQKNAIVEPPSESE